MNLPHRWVGPHFGTVPVLELGPHFWPVLAQGHYYLRPHIGIVKLQLRIGGGVHESNGHYFYKAVGL